MFLRVEAGRWICGIGPFRRSASPPEGGTAFYVNDFSLGAGEPWLVPARVWEADFSPLPCGPPEVEIDWKHLARGAFEQVFEEVMAELKAGRLQKAVLALAERGRLLHTPGSRLLAGALRQAGGPGLWSYGFSDGRRGFAGATPERLFSLSGERLQTMALAGTARPADEQGFLTDAKEIREHELVVESLAAKLAPFGPVQREERQVLDVGGLLHFITRFEVAAPTLELDRFLRALHPTPAIGVLPSDAENLRRLELWRERLGAPGSFGAPFGVVFPGGCHFVVCIRGVVWEEADVLLPSGCGVVEGSQLEREWRELALKREWTRRALALP